jgi:hypothetical protein
LAFPYLAALGQISSSRVASKQPREELRIKPPEANLKRASAVVALLMPLCAQAQTPDRCVSAVMSFSGAGETAVAVLDMHGQWHVSSWEGVTWIAVEPAEDVRQALNRQPLGHAE